MHVFQHTRHRGLRAGVGRVVAAVVTVAMVATSGQAAFADGPGDAARKAASARVGQPFTYQTVSSGYGWKQTFVKQDATTVRSTIEFTDPAGHTLFTGNSTAVRNADGSVTVRTTSPMLPEPDVRTLTAEEANAADPVCGPCAAAAGAAAAGAIIACAFTALLGCAAATGAAAAAAAAYCSTNPCAPSTPACSPETLIWQSQPGAGQLDYQYAANCTQTMDYITIRGQLLQNGNPIFDDTATCYSDTTCWEGWHAYNLPSACYRVRMYFDARWRNQATNEVKYFSGGQTSANQICF